jgi:acetyltransferase
MSIRNLKSLFGPASIALIGATPRPHSVGAVLAHNLLHAGFTGPIFPVNPHHGAIEGVLAYPDVASLPITPELAVLSTPPETVPALIDALGRRGTKAAVVITAGFGEGEDSHGTALRQAMLDAAKPHLLRIVGPNCLGILVPGIGLNASFSHLGARKGDLAFVTQSGAMVTAVLDWAEPHGIGFSHLVSLGDMSDVDFGDMLDYLAGDSGTRAILLYMEGVTHARKFMSAARSAARAKPVILVKAGRRAEGAKAASSHTGAMAGSDEVYDAAIRRAGMLRVYELDELFDAVETLALCKPMAGDRLAILTNGGGIGVMATDSLIEAGGRLALLSPETLAKLDSALPRTWSHGNPVDIIGDATAERYSAALKALVEEPDADAVLVLNCPTAVASSTDAARAVIAVAEPRKRNIFTSWVGDHAVREARHLFSEAGLPSYDTPNQAVRAFMHMVRYRRNQDMLMEAPPSAPEDFVPDRAAAQHVIEGVLAAGRDWLTEPEAKAVIAAYNIPTVETRIARTPEEAATCAADLGSAVAVKLLSPDITHKSDVGGVALDLATPAAARDAAAAILERVGASHPEARIEGFTVETMVHRPGAYELILGMSEDAQFGPVILFGQGGIAAEVLADKALALPPLNLALARELMERTRIFRLLRGYRNQPPAALDAVALTLVKISQLVVDLGEVAELDINPLLADASGVIALDARIRVRRSDKNPAERLAIRPYPKELEERIETARGETMLLRPIRPEDAPAFITLFGKLLPGDVRLRFFAPLKAMSPQFAARLTQLDYDREMGFVLCKPQPLPAEDELFGVVRVAADPDNETGEYAITVRSDMQGHGLGFLLMRRMIDYARARGLKRVIGDVLRENETMLKLCKEFGFEMHSHPDQHDAVRVELDLTCAPAELRLPGASFETAASPPPQDEVKL